VSDVKEVWAMHDTVAGGRLVGLHVSMKAARNAAGPVADDMEYTKLTVLTPAHAAVIAAAEAQRIACDEYSNCECEGTFCEHYHAWLKAAHVTNEAAYALTFEGHDPMTESISALRAPTPTEPTP